MSSLLSIHNPNQFHVHACPLHRKNQTTICVLETSSAHNATVKISTKQSTRALDAGQTFIQQKVEMTTISTSRQSVAAGRQEQRLRQPRLPQPKTPARIHEAHGPCREGTPDRRPLGAAAGSFGSSARAHVGSSLELLPDDPAPHECKRSGCHCHKEIEH